MRAIPRATPTMIPATVPLGSRLLGDGTGAPDVAFLVDLLLVLLEIWVIGVEVSLVVGPVVVVTEDAELTERPISGELGAADVRGLVGPLAKLEGAEELVELMPTSEDAGLEAGAVGPAYPPSSVIVGTPSVGRYIRE